MATKVNIIITENYVYATYVETICFKSKFEDEEEMHNVLNNAKATAFSYALGFSSVLLNQVNKPQFKTDDDIFEYLKLSK
jgi:hypothetical protein